LPGRRQSDWASDTKTIHDIADQLLADLPKQAIYIGWSIGGMISMSIAARFPERVERLIGVATTPKFIAVDDWPTGVKSGFRMPFEDGINKMGFEPFFKQYCEAEFDYPETRSSAHQAFIDLIDQTGNVDLDILYQGIDISDTTDLREEFKALRCPIDLILGGKDDSIPTSIHSVIETLNPRVNLHIIPDAHHMLPWTHQDEFKQILHSLL